MADNLDNSMEDLFTTNESVDQLFMEAFDSLNKCRTKLNGICVARASAPVDQDAPRGLVPQGEGGEQVKSLQRLV